MARAARSLVQVWVPLLLGLASLSAGMSGQTAQPSTANGEWPTYNADLKGTRINASNFSTLEPAWRFKTDRFDPFPEYKLVGTPLMVKGCSTRRPARADRSSCSTARPAS